MAEWQRTAKKVPDTFYLLSSGCVLFSSLTFGFVHEANLDEGAMWPTAFAFMMR